MFNVLWFELFHCCCFSFFFRLVSCKSKKKSLLHFFNMQSFWPFALFPVCVKNVLISLGLKFFVDFAVYLWMCNVWKLYTPSACKFSCIRLMKIYERFPSKWVSFPSYAWFSCFVAFSVSFLFALFCVYVRNSVLFSGYSLIVFHLLHILWSWNNQIYQEIGWFIDFEKLSIETRKMLLWCWMAMLG